MKTEFLRPAVPAIARLPCTGPAPLPDRDATESEATRDGLAYRSALRTCDGRRAAAVAAIDGTTP